MYTIGIRVLLGLSRVNSRDFHRLATFKQVIDDNDAVEQDDGELSQKLDSRCGPVALKCYKPILSYVDSNGVYCGWKSMESFIELPKVCASIQAISLMKWEVNVLKYNYKFIKACDAVKTFQQCVRTNEVCKSNNEINFVMEQQNTYCSNLPELLPVITCQNAWNSSVNWYKLVYTDWRIVQACPATHYRQLTLNLIKLLLFTYITSPSSWTDGAVESVNAEAAGHLICQDMQQVLCISKRGDEVCPGYLSLAASQGYNDNNVIIACVKRTSNVGKCNAFVKMNCTLNLKSGDMKVKMDFQDIRNIYNMTYWHAVGNSEVDILLHKDNKGIGHCDARNLIFKQIGCFHHYITQIDMNYANGGNYLSEYMCSNINIYSSCFETYVNSSCPDEANQFQGIGNFLHAQCNILRIATKNVTCPLHAVYSDTMHADNSWIDIIMKLMQQYLTVTKCKQMIQAPSGWRDAAQTNAQISVTHYTSVLIKAQKFVYAELYENVIISTVCDQEAADVYNDFVTISTGEQYYQLVNHVIKAYEYINNLSNEMN